MAKPAWIERAKRTPKFKVRAVRRCQRCGRARAVLRKFGLCRICFRELALRGEIPGVRGSVLGGTGIAVSAYSPQRDVAVAVARDLASEATQRGIYAQAGGQPAHRAAWTDDNVNARAENFFRDTLATLDASSLRPRFDGYIAFQRQAGALVGACIEKVIPIASAVDRLNDAFARAQGL